MTIQEIFNSPAVREIELQIILLLRKSEKNGRSGDADSIALTHLLKVRKNSMFIMNDEYNALLSEFNDALTEQLLEMRKQAIQMRDAILNINIEGNEIEAVGKAIWCVLNGTWDDYILLYSDGVDGGVRLCSDEEPLQKYSSCIMKKTSTTGTRDLTGK